MRETKFYKPKIARLTDNEVSFVNRASSAALGDAMFTFAMQEVVTTRNTIADYPQITYNFSSAKRNNRFGRRIYGSSYFSYRMLYDFLCAAYNGGNPFIDTYFARVFPTTGVYNNFMNIYTDIKTEIENERHSFNAPLKKDGTPDMRFNESRRLKNYKVWQNPIIKRNCVDVADAVRKDIVVKLSTGRIPLSKASLSDNTLHRRRLAGISSKEVFYASGRLIDNLNIFVSLDKEDLWRKAA